MNLLFLATVMQCARTSENPHPNILIIQPDQHRGDIMGIAGNAQVYTPNLDQLAAEGVYFTHAASATPVCSPFRATMQTGLYLHEHGVYVNGIHLNHAFRSIAEILSDSGYATGYIGKWHLEGFVPDVPVGGYIEPGPARQGWQEWNGYEKSHEYFNVWKYNEDRQKVRVEGYTWEPAWHTDMALEFIKRKSKDKNPWCYYIAFGPPHIPEECIPEFLEMYDLGEFTLPPGAEETMSAKDRQRLRRSMQVYYAQVTAIDHEVGRLQQGLKDLGVDDETMIIYVSDHGDVIGNHHQEIVEKYIEENRNLNNTLRTKGKPYSTAFRIPLIIKAPGTKEPGMVCDALVSSVDLVPTILDLAGMEVPGYMQGTSMAGWIEEGIGPRRSQVYLGLGNDERAWRAVWTGRYLLSELDYKVMYDLQADPDEIHNLYNDNAYAMVKKELQSRLTGLASGTGDPILPLLEQEINAGQNDK